MNLQRRTRLPIGKSPTAASRLRQRGTAGAGSPAGRARQLIGRDVEGSFFPSISGRWRAGLLIGSVIALLAIVHVRVQIIEQGYQFAQAVERVDELLIKRQRLKARVGALRNRDRLMSFAKKFGFDQPQREISLRSIDRMDP